MPVFVRQLQVGRHVRSGVRDVVVGVAGVALCFRGAGVPDVFPRAAAARVLDEIGVSHKRRLEFRLVDLLQARSRAKKSVRIPGGCRLAPVLRLPSVQASPGMQPNCTGGQVGRVRLERGEVSGVGLGEEVPVDPLIALLLCLQQHPPSDLATGAPRARLYLPSHSSTGAPDTSTSSTVPGIVQSARRPAGRAGALRADVVVVPVAAALSRSVIWFLAIRWHLGDRTASL
eukprot:tig00020801_g13888.t1